MNTSASQQLITSLKSEIASLADLNSILTAETTLLLEKNYSQLEAISTQKDVLSQKLETDAKARMALIGADPINKKNAVNALAEFTKGLDEAEIQQINDLNEDLKNKLIICRELNSKNAQLISAQIHVRKELIEILQGQTNNKASNIYTSTGSVEGKSAGSHHEEA